MSGALNKLCIMGSLANCSLGVILAMHLGCPHGRFRIILGFASCAWRLASMVTPACMGCQQQSMCRGLIWHPLRCARRTTALPASTTAPHPA